MKTRNEKLLYATFAMALLDTLKGEEKEKSALYNRCDGAVDAILRVCDIYMPNGLDEIKIAKIVNIVDGPVSDIISQYSHELADAIGISWT